MIRSTILLAMALASASGSGGLRVTAATPEAGKLVVERGTPALTHQAVPRAWPDQRRGYPVVGDADAGASDRWADLHFRYHFVLCNNGTKPVSVTARATAPKGFPFQVEVESSPVSVPPGDERPLTLHVTASGEKAAGLSRGYSAKLAVDLEAAGEKLPPQKVVFWVPAVAKMLAGASPDSVAADVLPAGADYADEFAGGWDGKRFSLPFIMGTAEQIREARRLFHTGAAKQHYPHRWGGVKQILAAYDPSQLPAKRGAGMHQRIAEAILSLAMHWVHEGEGDVDLEAPVDELPDPQRYARRARELILAYVTRAETLGYEKGAGRVWVNGLGEAWFCNPVFKAIDLLTATNAFSPGELRRIHAWMNFEARVMRPQLFGFNNQQCEELFPILVGGLITGDLQRARFAYYPPYGLEGQLSGAFYADGFHREHQIGYHWRSINPLLDMGETLIRLGYCVYDPRMLRAATNPIRRALGDRQQLGGGDRFAAQIAVLRYDDPVAAQWLRAHHGMENLSVLHGAERIPEGTDVWTGDGMNQPAAGETLLRGGRFTGGHRAASMHWGHSGKRHGRDFMDIVLYAFGTPFADGMSGVNETIGGNCIIVNEQVARRSVGAPDAMNLQGPVQFVSVTNPPQVEVDPAAGAQPWPWAWPWKDGQGTWVPLSMTGQGERGGEPMFDGTTWTRTLVCLEGGFLLIDRVRTDKPATVDRPIHVDLRPHFRMKVPEVSVELSPVKGPLGETPQYAAAVGEAAEDGQPVFLRGRTDKDWTVEGTTGDSRFRARVTVLGGAETDLALVNDLKLGWGWRSPFVLARRSGVTRTQFVMFFEPFSDDGEPRLQGIEALPARAGGEPLQDTDAVGLRLDFGDKRSVVLVNYTGRAVTCGDITSDRRFTCAAE